MRAKKMQVFVSPPYPSGLACTPSSVPTALWSFSKGGEHGLVRLAAGGGLCLRKLSETTSRDGAEGRDVSLRREHFAFFKVYVFSLF